MNTVKFKLLDREIIYDVSGDISYGQNEILIDHDDNLIKDLEWNRAGYTVTNFLSDDLTAKIRNGISHKIQIEVEKNTESTITNFNLANYHQYVNNDLHRKVCSTLYETCTTQFPIEFNLVEKRVSDICGKSLSALNPKLNRKVFCLRIIRPHSADNNPLHKDVWIDAYRNAVNVYIPVCESNEMSSLPVIPGSHYWRESDIARTNSGAEINGVPYHVPAVVAAKQPLTPIIPNPALHEIMVFSPYLIHGAAVNNNQTTRVSLEIRFWRA